MRAVLAGCVKHPSATGCVEMLGHERVVRIAHVPVVQVDEQPLGGWYVVSTRSGGTADLIETKPGMAGLAEYFTVSGDVMFDGDRPRFEAHS